MSYLQWPATCPFYSNLRGGDASGSGTGNEQFVKEMRKIRKRLRRNIMIKMEKRVNRRKSEIKR